MKASISQPKVMWNQLRGYIPKGNWNQYLDELDPDNTELSSKIQISHEQHLDSSDN